MSMPEWRKEAEESMMREDRILAWKNKIRNSPFVYPRHHTNSFGSESAIGPYKLTMAKKMVPLILNRLLKSSSCVRKLITYKNISSSATDASQMRKEYGSLLT
jgi:hypothetical protein